jgi:hypothetical protein
MNDQEKHETAVVEEMAKAQGIAESLFGDAAKTDEAATLEIYDYLDNGADEGEFAADLLRTIEYAKTAYGTDKPTPKQVFGLFARMFKTDED